jgi:hypothetical protein
LLCFIFLECEIISLFVYGRLQTFMNEPLRRAINRTGASNFGVPVYILKHVTQRKRSYVNFKFKADSSKIEQEVNNFSYFNNIILML